MNIDMLEKSIPLYSKIQMEEKKSQLSGAKNIYKLTDFLNVDYGVEDGFLNIIVEGNQTGRHGLSEDLSVEENKCRVTYQTGCVKTPGDRNKQVSDMNKGELQDLLHNSNPFYTQWTMNKIKKEINKYMGIRYDKSVIFNKINFMLLKIDNNTGTYYLDFLVPSNREDYFIEVEEKKICFKVKIEALKQIVGKKMPKLDADNVIEIVYNKNDNFNMDLNKNDLYQLAFAGLTSAFADKVDITVLNSPTASDKIIRVNKIKISSKNIVKNIVEKFINNFEFQNYLGEIFEITI